MVYLNDNYGEPMVAVSPLSLEEKRVQPPQLSVVVPCYNEEAVLVETARRLTELVAALKAHGRASQTSSICFVDDGSTDRTW